MSRMIQLFVCCLLAVAALRPATAREEVWEEELQYETRTRINQLIKGLNTTHMTRERFINELVELSNGKLRPLVMRQLRIALETSNSQIIEGIVETFARINDPVVIPLLEDEVLFNPSLDVRQGIIEHLPLFCVAAGKDRDDLIQFLESGESHMPENLIAALRKPPFNLTTGEYDLSMDEDIRGRIENALTWQLDPIEAVIDLGLEQRNQDRALDFLKELLGIDLGHGRSPWLDYWRSRGRTFESPLQSDLLDTQIAACQMLGYMGAEGRQSLIDRTRWLMSTRYNTARQAALEMLQSITAFAVAQEPILTERLSNPKIKQPEELWIKRRQEGGRRLIELTMELTRAYLNDENDGIRMALVDCLGATSSPEATSYIGQALRADGQSAEMRIHAVQALGQIADVEAELLLEQMAVFRGISVSHNLQVDEYQRVRVAFSALGQVLGAVRDGKLYTRNPTASAKAAEFLIGQLSDVRRFPGASARKGPEHQTVRFLAREILRATLHTAEESYNPADWRALYHQALP